LRMAAATAADQAGLRTWLRDWMAGQARPYWEKSGESEAWWRQGRGIAPPIADPFHDWSRTVAKLDECLVFRIRLKDARESRDVPAMELPASPLDLADPEPVRDNITKLTDLQLRAHFVWQPIVQEYREALALWIQGDPAGFKRKLAEAIADRDSLEE